MKKWGGSKPASARKSRTDPYEWYRGTLSSLFKRMGCVIGSAMLRKFSEAQGKGDVKRKDSRNAQS